VTLMQRQAPPTAAFLRQPTGGFFIRSRRPWAFGAFLLPTRNP